MNYRPAGMSDDDEDDDDDYFDTGRRSRPTRSSFQPTNGSPKTIEEAIRRKDLEAAKKFLSMSLSKGLSIDTCLPCGLPSLIIACSVGFVEVVEILLEKGANPNIETDMITPLSMCCTIGILLDETREACVDRLLLAGANPNIIDSRGRVPLMLASTYGFIRVVTRLLASPKTSLTVTDPRGWTALFFAMESQNAEIADLLIKSGLNPNIKDKDGCTATDLFYLEEHAPDVTVAELFADPAVPDVAFSVEKLGEPSERILKEFLSQLPDPSGNGGFSATVRDILDGSGCQNLILPDADLFSVLCGSDEELKRLGVKIAPLRRKILRSVHRYHLRPWSNMSLFQPPGNSELGMDDAVNMIATALRHLVIMRSSLTYLRGRLSRCSGKHADVSARQEQVKVLVDIHKVQTQLQRHLRALLSQCEKVRDIGDTRPGYIAPTKSTGSSLFSFKAVTAFATILIAAFVFFRSR